jgi:hypothetical protein
VSESASEQINESIKKKNTKTDCDKEEEHNDISIIIIPTKRRSHLRRESWTTGESLVYRCLVCSRDSYYYIVQQ